MPQFSTAEQRYVLTQDWFVARLSSGGTLTAPIQPAGWPTGVLSTISQNSCPEALLCCNVWTCACDVQVANAENAGAAAVILYKSQSALAIQNQSGRASGGGPGDGNPFPARLTCPATIPMAGVVSYAVGSDLCHRYVTGNARRASRLEGLFRPA